MFAPSLSFPLLRAAKIEIRELTKIQVELFEKFMLKIFLDANCGEPGGQPELY